MLPERISSAFQTAAQGLDVQRKRINVASRNIANINTSSARGDSNIYRPQSVKTSSPEPSSFEKVLSESMSSLKKTRPQHLSSTPENGQQKQQGLGPSHQVSESDNFRYEYEPNHPDANEEGMVRYPDIDMVQEMTRMVSANRLFEANLSAIEAEKQIMKQAMNI